MPLLVSSTQSAGMGKSWTDCQLARLITADHWSFCPIPSRLEFCNWLVWASSLAFSTPCQSTPAILSPEERGEVIKAKCSEQTSHSEASFLQAINYSGILLPILRKRNYCLFSRVQIKCIIEAAYLIILCTHPWTISHKQFCSNEVSNDEQEWYIFDLWAASWHVCP